MSATDSHGYTWPGAKTAAAAEHLHDVLARKRIEEMSARTLYQLAHSVIEIRMMLERLPRTSVPEDKQTGLRLTLLDLAKRCQEAANTISNS